MYNQFVFLGVPSTDNHARFNLSPVPSVDDDDDNEGDGINHRDRRDYPNIDEDDSGEEVDLTGGALGSTTTVTMFDQTQDVTSPSDNKYGNGDGKRLFFL